MNSANYISRMESAVYAAISLYLQNGTITDGVATTRSNFRRKANQFQLNAAGALLHNGRIVVKHDEQQKIFDQMHGNINTLYICPILEQILN